MLFERNTLYFGHLSPVRTQCRTNVAFSSQRAYESEQFRRLLVLTTGPRRLEKYSFAVMFEGQCGLPCDHSFEHGRFVALDVVSLKYKHPA